MDTLKYGSTLLFLLAIQLASVVFLNANAAIVFSNDIYYQTEMYLNSNDAANTESGKSLDIKELEDFKRRKNECSIFATNPQKYFGCLEYQ